jgi:hypothetical protein
MNISSNCAHDFHGDCKFEAGACSCDCHYICTFSNKRPFFQNLWMLIIDIKKGFSDGFIQ